MNRMRLISSLAFQAHILRIPFSALNLRPHGYKNLSHLHRKT